MLGISAGRPRTALKAELSHAISSKIPLSTKELHEQQGRILCYFLTFVPFEIQSFIRIKIKGKKKKKTKAGKQQSAYKLSCWSGCRQELGSQISAPRVAGRVSISGSLCLWGSAHFSASPLSLPLLFVQGFTGSQGQGTWGWREHITGTWISVVHSNK